MARVQLAAVNAAFGLALVAAAKAAEAGSVESAGAYYDETQLTSEVASVAADADTDKLWKGEGRKTSAHLGYTGKRIKFKKPGDLLQEQLSHGKSTISEHSLSAGLDQGFRVGTQLGVFGGGTKSKLSDARYYGVKFTQWFRSETLQTTTELRRTDIKSPPVQYTDTDGKRIRTPADLHGLNASLAVTHFTTPTTIIRGAVSGTQRSDRPPATSESLEIRQFITAADAAAHFALTHYENVGQIADTQTYGSIVANNARAEWHQRLLGRGVLMGGYRYYLENEKPRAEEVPRRKLGTDAIYSSFRWRFGNNLWTADAPEAYLFASRYNTNVPTSGYVVGLGGRIPW